MTGKEINSYTFEDSSFVNFTPDGESFIIGMRNGSIYLWDIDTYDWVHTFKGHSNDIISIDFSPNGNYMMSGSYDRSLKLWDMETRKEVKTFKGHKDAVTFVKFSPDGQYVISSSFDNTLKLWNVNTGKEIRTFRGHTDHVNSVDFSPDGKMLISGSNDRTLKLWNVNTGKELHTFAGHQARVESGLFFPDGRYIASGSFDGTVRIWDSNNGKMFYAFLSNKNASKWLIYNNDGYWDSARDGGDYVSMVKGMNVWNIDQFALHNNRPDIILGKMDLISKDVIDHWYSQYQKRLARLGLIESDLATNYDTPVSKIIESEQNDKYINLKFNVQVSNKSNLLSRYNIYVNDVPLFGSYGKEITGTEQTMTEQIELSAGENKIEVSCINNRGTESYRDVVYKKYAKPVTGDLYYLGFGVSDYADPMINDLEYADDDIVDQATLFKKMKGRGFNNVYINTYINDQVTPEVFSNVKSFLKDAGVDDTFILSIAGHGLHDQDAYLTYYYITHDTQLDNLAETAASFETIEELLQGIAPRQKLFLMDTCDSGQADKPLRMAATNFDGSSGISGRVITVEGNDDYLPPPRPWLNDRDRYIYNDLVRRSGAIVFSSSNAGEISFESKALKNGYFTEEVLNALTSRVADTNGDGIISTEELYSFVSANVRKRSEEDANPNLVQTPTIDRDNIYINFGFPVIED